MYFCRIMLEQKAGCHQTVLKAVLLGEDRGMKSKEHVERGERVNVGGSFKFKSTGRVLQGADSRSSVRAVQRISLVASG